MEIQFVLGGQNVRIKLGPWAFAAIIICEIWADFKSGGRSWDVTERVLGWPSLCPPCPEVEVQSSWARSAVVATAILLGRWR
jgi:hypothetical protein